MADYEDNKPGPDTHQTMHNPHFCWPTLSALCQPLHKGS